MVTEWSYSSSFPAKNILLTFQMEQNGTFSNISALLVYITATRINCLDRILPLEVAAEVEGCAQVKISINLNVMITSAFLWKNNFHNHMSSSNSVFSIL